MILKDLFDCVKSPSLDLNKLVRSNSKSALNYVSRTGCNQGVSAYVERVVSVEPFKAGSITVALGGSILSSFVQQKEFYKGTHLVVLTPKKEMTLQEKMYYCLCIQKNVDKYSAYGRDADRTLTKLEMPNDIPTWVNDKIIPSMSTNSLTKKKHIQHNIQYGFFRYDDLFSIETSQNITKSMLESDGNTPLVTSGSKNNGWVGFTTQTQQHKGNVISVNQNGTIGEAFYQPFQFCTASGVYVLNPKFQLNVYIAMFLTSLIQMEKYRYNYGYKWSLAKMKKTSIRLPITNNKEPDWEYMENYIKSLPCSESLN